MGILFSLNKKMKLGVLNCKEMINHVFSKTFMSKPVKINKYIFSLKDPHPKFDNDLIHQ